MPTLHDDVRGRGAYAVKDGPHLSPAVKRLRHAFGSARLFARGHLRGGGGYVIFNEITVLQVAGS
jgi:hypothetical protein